MKASPMVWTGRVLTVLFALFMLGASITPKLMGMPVASETMTALGWPAEYTLAIGLTELGCVLLYLFPRTSVLGAVLMTGLLGGAMATQIRVGNPLFSHQLFSIYLGLFMWGGLWLRNASLRMLFPIREDAGMSIAATIPEQLTHLNIVREFDAPRALVWKMWTDPAHAAVWWAPEHFTTPKVEMDLRPGGAIHVVMRAPDGQDHPFDGRFIAIEEPERLTFRSWVTHPDGGVWFAVEQTIRLEEVDGRSIQHFDAVVVEAREDAIGPLSGMEAGWNQTLDKLAAHVRVVATA